MNGAPNILNRATVAPRGRPVAWLVGQSDHADFRDDVALLRGDADVVVVRDKQLERATPPELIVVAQCQPNAIDRCELERLRHMAPLAGVVVLLGSWCEGHTRTGRPLPGTLSLYWHEFAAWWRRQIALRAAGRCPDWARPVGNFGLRIADCRLDCANGELVVLSTEHWETAHALAAVLAVAGYRTAWQPRGRGEAATCGAAAGIWEGGQLDDCEADELAAFCRIMARNATPVVALLDFPRRDSVDRAVELGAAAVLGKPWGNSALLATIEHTKSVNVPRFAA